MKTWEEIYEIGPGQKFPEFEADCMTSKGVQKGVFRTLTWEEIKEVKPGDTYWYQPGDSWDALPFKESSPIKEVRILPAHPAPYAREREEIILRTEKGETHLYGNIHDGQMYTKIERR